jgi:hypothetical protein
MRLSPPPAKPQFKFAVSRRPSPADTLSCATATDTLRLWVHNHWGRKRLATLLGVTPRVVDSWFTTRRIPPRYLVALDMLRTWREAGMKLNDFWPEVVRWPTIEESAEFKPLCPLLGLRPEIAAVFSAMPSSEPDMDMGLFNELYWAPPVTYTALQCLKAVEEVNAANRLGTQHTLSKTTKWLATQRFSMQKAIKMRNEESKSRDNAARQTTPGFSYEDLLDEEERLATEHQARMDRVSAENAEFDRMRDAASLSGGTGQDLAAQSLDYQRELATMPARAPGNAYTRDSSDLSINVAGMTAQERIARAMADFEFTESEAIEALFGGGAGAMESGDWGDYDENAETAYPS